MAEGIFNQKELRLFEDLNKNIKSVDKSIKDFATLIQRLNNRTNRNTLMYRMVEAIETVADEIKKQGKKE